MTDAMPKIDYTGFIFDFVPNGIHIAKRDKSTFKVDCSLYSSTEIDWRYGKVHAMYITYGYK